MGTVRRGWTFFVERNEAPDVVNALRRLGYDVDVSQVADRFVINIADSLEPLDLAARERLLDIICAELMWLR